MFRGQGMEFAEVRAYEHGDDFRSIDWNVSARLGSPYVKTFTEERELTLMLVVDQSGSTRFGEPLTKARWRSRWPRCSPCGRRQAGRALMQRISNAVTSAANPESPVADTGQAWC